MLHQSRFFKRYWVEKLLEGGFSLESASYRVLGMKLPFEFFFGSKPDYNSSRVFCSRCFPYFRDYTKNKFVALSLPCVFLGYRDCHKGYHVSILQLVESINLDMSSLMRPYFSISCLVHCFRIKVIKWGYLNYKLARLGHDRQHQTRNSHFCICNKVRYLLTQINLCWLIELCQEDHIDGGESNVHPNHVKIIDSSGATLKSPCNLTYEDSTMDVPHDFSIAHLPNQNNPMII